MSEVAGLAFPLYSDIIKRAVREDKKVFAKFSRREASEGQKLYLYASGENGERQLIAGGEISDAAHITAEEVRQKYADRLLQTQSELDEYIAGREGREMLVLELDDLQFLNNPVDPPGNMTVAGLYLDADQVATIQERAGD